jgi:hypothetical protein
MITQAELFESLSYSTETGVFTWIRNVKRKKVGDIAGSISNTGYVRIMVNRKRYLAHRLAWLYVYGEFPSGSLDHINHNRTDNRISNLRIVTHTENCQNRTPVTNGITKTLGVYHTPNKRGRKHWRSSIFVNGKSIFLGWHLTKEEARQKYVEAKIKYHIKS